MSYGPALLEGLPLFDSAPREPERETRETRARDAALESLADRRRGYLDAIRAEMRRRSLEGEGTRFDDGRIVTPDEAREFFEDELRPPPPEVLSRNFLGAVWKEPGWRAVAFTKSRTEGSHANRLCAWIYEVAGGGPT